MSNLLEEKHRTEFSFEQYLSRTTMCQCQHQQFEPSETKLDSSLPEGNESLGLTGEHSTTGGSTFGSTARYQ